MNKRNSAGCGSIMFIAIGAGIYELTKNNSADIGMWIVGIFLCVFAYAILRRLIVGNGMCQVCNQKIQRKGGIVDINGKRYRACAECVRNARAKFSKIALKKKGL